MRCTEGKRALRNRLAEKQKNLRVARARLQDRVASDPPPPAFEHLSAIEIQAKLQSGELTPFEALRIYQKKIIDVLDCHAICDVIEEAEIATKSIDAECNSTIRGLPVSIKENIAIAGYDATLGLVSRALKPQTEDSPLILVLRQAGAVPFVTSTMSPTGKCIDASTEIFGIQRNPHDSKRLAGGSSSGEAILITKGASPLGFGSDIAGSLRIPAAFCGICSLKPTSNRISTIGAQSTPKLGSIVLKHVFGPMSLHVRLLCDAMRAILTPTMFRLDPQVHPIPFREDLFSSKKPLVIGFYTSLGGDVAGRTVPSIERAVLLAKTILEARGHRVVEFEVPEPDKLAHLASSCMFADGGISICEATRNDPTNARLRGTRFLFNLPTSLLRTSAWLISATFSSALGQVIRSSTGCRNPAEMLSTMLEVEKYQEEFAKKWASAKLDVLLCPVLPFPALLESVPDPLLAGGVVYTSMYNLLDYPCGVVPVGKVNESDVSEALAREVEYRKARDLVNAAHSRWQKNTKGLPITVQVVGRPLEDETVLRVMTEIEDACSTN